MYNFWRNKTVTETNTSCIVQEKEKPLVDGPITTSGLSGEGEKAIEVLVRSTRRPATQKFIKNVQIAAEIQIDGISI